MSLQDAIDAAYEKEKQETISKLTAEISSLKKQLEELRSQLHDPVTVHHNILRGDIVLTKEAAIHIAGLPANIEKQFEEAKGIIKRIAGVMKDVDCRDSEYELCEAVSMTKNVLATGSSLLEREG